MIVVELLWLHAGCSAMSVITNRISNPPTTRRLRPSVPPSPMPNSVKPPIGSHIAYATPGGRVAAIVVVRAVVLIVKVTLDGLCPCSVTGVVEKVQLTPLGSPDGHASEMLAVYVPLDPSVESVTEPKVAGFPAVTV